MGKYMKKSKVTGEVVEVMEPTKSTTGVCTRARTQKLLNSSSSSSISLSSSSSSSSSLCYLQLRSRRLQKAPPLVVVASPKPKKKDDDERKILGFGVGEEPSFGDSCFESLLPIDGSTRESTPCSLLRDSEAIRTPGSTTRRTSSTSANRRAGIDAHRNIPTTDEMEEFFSIAERQQHRLFMEKYNFDVVNDMPLPGRFEWFQVVQ